MEKTTKKTVFAYLHTHWDREWYRSRESFLVRLLEVMDTVLEELQSRRAPFFYLDGQVSALIDYFKYRPENAQIVKKLIKQQKLLIGPYFVSADSYMPNFCAMMKNLQIGAEYSKALGQKDFIGYMSDIFGVSRAAFAALKLNNIKNALIWRGINPEDIQNNCNFKYENLDVCWLSMGYFNDFCHSGNIEGLKNYLEKIAKYSKNPLLLPIGADHLNILKDASNVIAKINSKLDCYKIILTNPFEYFKKAKFSAPCAVEEFLDNSNTYVLKGTYSTRIPQKIKNAVVQNKISKIAEPLNFYLKAGFGEVLCEIWKTLLKNHAHDSICGCSIDSVARNVDCRFEKCDNMLDAILHAICHKFKTQHKIKGFSSDKIGLFNLGSGSFETLTLKLPYVIPNAQVTNCEKYFPQYIYDDTYSIPVTEQIGNIYSQIVEVEKNNPFEFSVLKIKKPKKTVQVSEKSIENRYIKLSVLNKKIVIENKTSNKKIYFKLTDIKDKGDTYNSAPSGKHNVFEIKKTNILYDGAIESALRLEFRDILLDIFLNNKSNFVRFKLTLKNKTKDHKIQSVFVLPEKIEKTSATDAIGTIQRHHDPDYNIQDHIPASDGRELQSNTYPLSYFVCAQGISVITKGLLEYEIYKNELKICNLRCTGTISNPKNPCRAIPAGPDLKTPEAQCEGTITQEFAFAFANEKNSWRIVDEFYKNYVTIDGAFENVSNFKLDDIEGGVFFGLSENKKILYNPNSNKIYLKE